MAQTWDELIASMQAGRGDGAEGGGNPVSYTGVNPFTGRSQGYLANYNEMSPFVGDSQNGGNAYGLRGLAYMDPNYSVNLENPYDPEPWMTELRRGADGNVEKAHYKTENTITGAGWLPYLMMAIAGGGIAAAGSSAGAGAAAGEGAAA